MNIPEPWLSIKLQRRGNIAVAIIKGVVEVESGLVIRAEETRDYHECYRYSGWAYDRRTDKALFSIDVFSETIGTVVGIASVYCQIFHNEPNDELKPEEAAGLEEMTREIASRYVNVLDLMANAYRQSDEGEGASG